MATSTGPSAAALKRPLVLVRLLLSARSPRAIELPKPLYMPRATTAWQLYSMANPFPSSSAIAELAPSLRQPVSIELSRQPSQPGFRRGASLRKGRDHGFADVHLARRIPLVHTQCALKLRKPFLRIVAVGMLVKIGAPIGKVHIRGVRVEGVKKPVRLVCREGRLASLLGELALHRT